MTLAIVGLGTAVPTTVIDQDQALRIARSLCCRTAEQETWLPAMYGHTGIERRHLVLGGAVVRDVLDGTRHSESPFLPTGAPDDCGPTTRQRLEHYEAAAGPLALAAARGALAQGGRAARAVTHLVTVSCTGFRAPGVDVDLIQGLPLLPTVQRTHIGYMGCHGALNGLRVANAFCAADPNTCVLLCATELCSLHYHYGWDPQKVIAERTLPKVCLPLVERAKAHFAKADEIMKRNSRRAVRAPRIMSKYYRATLELLVARGFAAPRAPVRVNKMAKIAILIRYSII